MTNFKKVENNSILQLGEWMRDWGKLKSLFLKPDVAIRQMIDWGEVESNPMLQLG